MLVLPLSYLISIMWMYKEREKKYEIIQEQKVRS